MKFFSIMKKRNVQSNKYETGIHSIRVKLVAAFLVMIIPISVLGFVSQNLTSDAVEEQAKQSVAQTVKQTGEYMDLFFAVVQNQYMQVFADDAVQKYINTSDNDGELFEIFELKQAAGKTLTNFLLSNEYLSSAAILMEGHRSIGTVGSSLHNFDFTQINETAWYQRAVEKGGITWIGQHPELDALIGETGVEDYALSAIGIVKSYSSSEQAGIIVLDIKREFVEDIIKDIHLGEGGELHLISPDGYAVSSIESDDVKQIVEQDFYEEIQNHPELSGLKTVTYQQNEYLMVFEKLPSTGHVLVGLLPRAELFTAAKKINDWTLGLLILAALAAVGMGLYMAVGMGRTINRIIEVAGRAETGILTDNPVSNRRDELGILTRSIAKMIANVRQLIQQVINVAHKVDHSAGVVASTTQQAAASSQEIARGIEEISRGASEQAGDAEKGTLKIDQLATKIGNVSDNAKMIQNISQDTMGLVQQGLSAVEDLDQKSHDTASVTGTIMQDMNSLEEQSRSIDKITKVLNGIVEQTKLLALNAAIEAARAGEMGKGFAVVAAEVTKLADQSMVSTKEITAIIKATQKQTIETVARAQTADEIVKSQNQSVATTISVFKQIVTSMDSLVTRVEQIMAEIIEMETHKNGAVLAMQSISAVSEQTAASSQQITASSEEQVSGIEELAGFAQELSDASQQLSRYIEKFKIK
ncbi:MAG: methyl-accepting chemotaxis protein [Firmicutes bacterium]|nr:methyl-accepting chemotaxis protein [Bacillota bacterium]